MHIPTLEYCLGFSIESLIFQEPFECPDFLRYFTWHFGELENRGGYQMEDEGDLLITEGEARVLWALVRAAARIELSQEPEVIGLYRELLMKLQGRINPLWLAEIEGQRIGGRRG